MTVAEPPPKCYRESLAAALDQEYHRLFSEFEQIKEQRTVNGECKDLSLQILKLNSRVVVSGIETDLVNLASLATLNFHVLDYNPREPIQ